MTTRTKALAREKRQARWLERTLMQRACGEARRERAALNPLASWRGTSPIELMQKTDAFASEPVNGD